jgi:hypothetical protein
MVKRNIIVKDYLYSGNYIFGTFCKIRKDEIFYMMTEIYFQKKK